MLLEFILILGLSAFFSSLGVGGAFIYIPLFFWLGYPLKFSILIGIFLSMISSGTAFYNFNSILKLDLSKILFIFIGALFGVPIGVLASTYLSEVYLLLFFIALLLFASFKLAFPSIPRKHLTLSPLNSFFIGSTAGIMGGALGIGGGVFLTPILMERGFSHKKAAAFSVAIVFLISTFSFLSHIIIEEYDLLFLGVIGISAIVGSFYGSKHTAEGKFDESLVRRIFATILLLFALKLSADLLQLIS